MKKIHRIVVGCDIHILWQGETPRYRVWVENQMFQERQFTWDSCYIEEHYAMHCNQGKIPGEVRHYQVRHELLDVEQATMIVNNWRIMSGDATIDQQGLVSVRHG